MLKYSSVHEILLSLCSLPLAYTDLRTSIDPRVTCSDASMSGGGVCVSTGASLIGEQDLSSINEIRYSLPSNTHVSIGTVRVMIVGLFDGLGGLRIAFRKLNKYVVVMCYISRRLSTMPHVTLSQFKHCIHVTVQVPDSARASWRDVKHTFQVYHYEHCNMIWDVTNSNFVLPSAE